MRTEYLLEPKEKVERWGPGIWTDEPDEAEWVHEASGLPCLVLRQLEMGAFCGYVGLSPAHPWHRVDVDELEVAVHCGLSFSGVYEDTGVVSRLPATALSPARKNTLSGKPDPSYLGYRFVGFDCMHAGDLVPGLRRRIRELAAQPLVIASRCTPAFESPLWEEGLSGAERAQFMKQLRDPMARYLIDIYRDFVWVRQEVELLAAQAAKARGPRT